MRRGRARRIADARKERNRIKLAVGEGRDPLPEKSAVRTQVKAKVEEASLWRTLADAYVKFRRRDGAAYRTMVKLEQQVGYTLPVLGAMPIGSITATDVLAVVRPIEDSGRVQTAHEVRTRCSQIFEFAEAHGFPNSNPSKVARGAMMKRRPGNFRGLTDKADVSRLMRAIRQDCGGEPQVRTALLLSAYLFPRNTELRGMCWDEIDWERAIWEVPGERMKMGRDHIIPLPRQALAVLRDIQSWTGRSKLVLPAPRDSSKMLSDMTFNKSLRRLGFSAREHVHHGFRTMASTSLNELGFNRDWIERQLAHVEGNKVRGTYNKAQYLSGRADMMQTYADWLDGLDANS